MIATGNFGPAPPGIDISENQQARMLGAVVSLMIIGTLAVILRLYTRAKTSQTNFGLDDFLILVSLLFAYGTAACVIISLKYKNGWHQQALTDSEFTVLWKLLLAHVFIYSTTITLTKCSIMMFYRRILNIQWSLYISMCIILGYFVAVIITMSVACRPLSHFWEQYTYPEAEGACINVSQFFLFNGIAAVIIDVMILCVPAPIIWKLKMPRTQRLAVISILLLGGFVCVAGIVRVIFLHKNIHSDDPSWTIAPVFMWSCVEPFIGILCACLPTISPMFRRWWSALGVKKSDARNKEDYHGTAGSRTHRSRQQYPEDNEDEEHHGDEVQLTSFPGWPLNLLRGKDSRDDVAASRSRIQVKEEVTISWN
ncbi:uncharacterized protein N7511_007554 [Penicillium nucicola]|uniref:uncharacterized protein n=1 Tax=Penicillium nucicola TaxID=1850975 RepID=UPI0025455C63|nr:uncharacterized protein N7511_007554 [Penicillium nucicola]KAJ5753401.1 hypothetical protein N7511_007554 [Penicillium nucicola]